MKSGGRLGWFLAVILGVGLPDRLAAGGPEFPVLALSMDEAQVPAVITHPRIGLLIQFPGPITDYAGRGFVEHPEANRGDFMLRFVPGDPYLVVTPLVAGATGTLHVIVDGRAYSLQLVPGEYEAAWQKILFVGRNTAEPGTERGKAAEAVRVKKPPAENRLEKPSANRIVGALAMGRWLDTMTRTRALSAVRANPALRLVFRKEEVTQGPAVLRIQWVLRNDILDTLVFSVTVENRGKEAIDFIPDSWLVRVGDHVYPCVAVDFDPHVPAGKTSKAYFALLGDGMGKPNWLSPENHFRISLSEANTAQPRPASST